MNWTKLNRALARALETDWQPRLLLAGEEDGDDDAGGAGAAGDAGGDRGDGGPGGGSMLESLDGGSGDGGSGEGGEGGGGETPSHVVTFGEDGLIGDRPDWVPEQLWDGEKGLDVAKAMGSYTALRKEFNQKVAEAQGMDKGEALKSADDYLAEFKAPESTEERDVSKWGDVTADDAAVKAFANVAHRHGLSKDRFNAMVSDFLAEANEHLADPVNMADEWGKLGGEKRGKALGAAVVGDLKAMTGDVPGALNEQELASMLQFGNDATRISAMSKLMAAVRGTTPPTIPSGGVQLDGLPSKQEVHAWQGEVVKDGPNAGALRYDVDPVWREKVDKAWEAVEGTEARSSSSLPVGGGNA